jgi:O-antigen/teichoic acid export membrane protein
LAADKRLLGTGALVVVLAMVDQGLVSAARFVTNVIIGRACGKDELGLYALGFSVLLLVVCAQESLITTPYTVLGGRLQGRCRAVQAAAALWQHGALALLCLLGGTVGGLAAIAAGHQRIAWVVVAVALGIAGTLMREFARRMALAQMRVGVAALIDAVFAVLMVGGLLAVARGGVLSAKTAYVVVGLSCAAVAVAWLARNREAFAWAPAEASGSMRESWRFGRWVFAGQIVLATSTAILPWLAAVTRGNSEAGALAACMQIVLLTNPLVIAAGNVLMPQAARAAIQGPAAVRSILGRATLWLAAAMGLFGLVILLGGEQVMGLVYGRQFQGYGHALAVLALAALATAIALPADVGLQVLQRPGANLRANVAGLLATAAVAGLCAAPLGLMGIAYGWLAGCVVASAWRMVGFARAAAAAEGGAQ